MWLYNNNHKKTEFLAHYKDRKIESVLSTGDKTLNFKYPMNKAQNIAEECYIRTKTDEYVIKETKTEDEWLDITATLNVEELEGKLIENFSSETKTITECLNSILAGTGWSVGYCEITKKRTLVGTYKSAWTLSQECINTYLCELEYDTINKKINVYEKRGSYKGVFMIDNVNVKDIDIQSNSYDFYTRLIPIGKDGLSIASINNGKPYIENYQYSKKVKTQFWKDERYTIVEHLLEDAIVKLDEMSQPVKAYEVSLLDLAKIDNNKYKAYEFGLGDTILLKSKLKNLKLKHRIVKYTEYPENPNENKVSLSTVKITFEDIQKKYNDTVDTVENVVNADGTVSSSSIDNVDGSKIVNNTVGYYKLTDELKEKIDMIEDTTCVLTNKKILLIGDDFVAGGNIEKTDTWGQLIANKNLMTIYNHGLNGASITQFDDEETDSIVENIESILSNVDEVDFIVFCAGHHDSEKLLEIGEKSDTVNTTLKGALNIIFSSIINKFPKSNILVLSPFNRNNNEDTYVDAIKEIAGIYSIAFFDNYRELGISMNNPSQKLIYESEDSLFLNELGHTKISLKYENLLKNL